MACSKRKLRMDKKPWTKRIQPSILNVWFRPSISNRSTQLESTWPEDSHDDFNFQIRALLRLTIELLYISYRTDSAELVVAREDTNVQKVFGIINYLNWSFIDFITWWSYEWNVWLLGGLVRCHIDRCSWTIGPSLQSLNSLRYRYIIVKWLK